MHSIDEVVRVAVVGDPRRLCVSQARLLEALTRNELPGFRLDLPGRGVPVGAQHDLLHLLTPAPGATWMAAEHDIGVVAGFGAARGAEARACRILLSPGPRADARLLAEGAHPGQLRRWQPGVDPEAFGPGHYDADVLGPVGTRINVLVAGEPESPGLLSAAFEAAVTREPRLRRVSLSAGADLPRLYASADLLVVHSSSDDFPVEVIEAQASGLPVLAVDAGALSELIEDGRTGVLVPARPDALAEALLSLARRARLRERLTVGGLGTVAGHSWPSSLNTLTSAWSAALSGAPSGLLRAV